MDSTQNSGLKMTKKFLKKSSNFCQERFFEPRYDFFLEKSLKNVKKSSRDGPTEIFKIKNLKIQTILGLNMKKTRAHRNYYYF